jgi:squalene-associated FAD-dependent desaturase
MPDSVLIIGGGLAGLAAATALAPHGFRVTVLESRNRLGGRAGSFVDATTGQVIDACQHVSMGCCTEFARFCRTVGIDQLIVPQPTLYFITPDRRISPFRADALPAPLHLARSFLGAHFLTASEKLRIAWGLTRLMHTPPEADPPFRQWLLTHRQTERTIDRFWGLVLVSALNESVDRVGLRHARKVFRDAFIADRRGFEVQVPSVPLGRLYGDELADWLSRHGVQVSLNSSVSNIDVRDGQISGMRLRDGTIATADVYISSVPSDRLLDLLPDGLAEREPYFGDLRRFEVSPITSVHLWFDQNVMELPHAVLIDCLGQWVFNRREVRPGEHYLQVVVSAARAIRGLRGDEIQRRIVDELRQLFPRVGSATLVRGRVVTEHAATFSAVPGVDRWRPKSESPMQNLLLAGDWTATGWPATMEGAVRSGLAAAAAVMRRRGALVHDPFAASRNSRKSRR